VKSTEIEHNVQRIIDNFSKEDFIYDLLIAYGISKTSVTRLKKGDYNLSKVEGEILYKKKIFFKVEKSDKLLSSIDEISKESRILKQNPRFVILTDFKHLVAKDLKLGTNIDIEIKDLPNRFDFFLPLAGSEVYNASNDNEADRNASYKMADLYDLLIEENPEIYKSQDDIHNLNIFLSRLLFCFFAEDTEIFEDDIFTNTLAQHTTTNGKDTHTFLDQLFERLNTENGDKYPDYLAKFPYVNGGLFKDSINSPKFTLKARKTLIQLGDLEWKNINPDIFGSMIQAVVIPDYRSDLGMHYTSVINILKLIKPLFLDELYEEFETSASSVTKLRKLILRISKIKFFDPACGSGNFLIITYKEIRLLEIKILEKIIDLEPNPNFEWTSIQLSQFYGIEIDDFAHEMAILSLWLAEHQMNRVFEDTLFDYGKSKPILPLKEAGQITQGNATRVDWKIVCPISKTDEVYVIGNPPYLGFRNWDKEQKDDMNLIFHSLGNVKRLDYIGCWFKKATDYIISFNAKYAFVSTSSVCQGEQVSLLWPYVFSKNLEISFAYEPFNWTNNAKGNAGVTVVIIGIQNAIDNIKVLFKKNRKIEVKGISPYLIPGKSTIMYQRKIPLSKFPIMMLGSSGIDGGHLMISEEDKTKFLDQNPLSKKFIKPFLSGGDFLNGVVRYCLWIEDIDIEEAKSIEAIKNRIDLCRAYRLKGGRDAKKGAEIPHRFFYRKYKNTESIIVPRTSSGRRNYLPCGFLNSEIIVSNQAFVVYGAEPYLFGILSSRIHCLWMSITSGKMRQDYSYSVNLTYNTFPFPNISTKQKENLNLYVFAILDERAKHPSKTMAQLYNPDTMPKGLLQAHQELDTAIEQCYRLQPFKNDTERLEYLFKQYEEMTKKDTLFAKQKKTRKNR
jgi:MmeI, DNA-methyltransferase domain/MmeI, target recognition domain/MmeI, N-terminal domain/MmeI, helicase spacer domain/MmeI, C-terminal domain